jgi:hypothetical protein
VTARSPGHAAPARPSIFRLGLRMPWRKPAAPGPVAEQDARVPADATPGAAVARFACCPHCEGRCAHPDNHPVACSDGCNAPVLGDRMIADVRREWNAQLAHADAMHALNARYLPQPRRPVNGVRRPTGPLLASPTHPPWPTAAMPVLPAEPPVPFAELNEQFDGQPSVKTLRAVIAGLRKL